MQVRIPGIYITDLQYKKQVAQEQLKWIDTLALPNKKLLDIGAGNGAFCAAAIDYGYEVVGTEISIQAIRRAKEMFGVNLVQGDIDSISERSRFGIITMWDVIEHLRDPLKMLREVRKRLYKDGLVIIETGNYECVDRLVYGKKWGLYLFDHMYYFSPQSLEKLFEMAGFKEFRIHRFPSSIFEAPKANTSETFGLFSIIHKFRHPWKIYNPLRILFRLPYATIIARKRYPNHWDLSELVASARK